MYSKTAKRDKAGKILHQVRMRAPASWVLFSLCLKSLAQIADTHTGFQDLQSKDLPNTRIQPDRRWFGNTRVIGQKQLDQFRDEMSAKVSSIHVVAFSIHVLFCLG